MDAAFYLWVPDAHIDPGTSHCFRLDSSYDRDPADRPSLKRGVVVEKADLRRSAFCDDQEQVQHFTPMTLRTEDQVT